MISSISFQNFRGLKELELVNLCPVTLISGKNNAGKSSILEGIFLLFDHAAPQSFIKISRFRNLPVVTDSAVLWTSLFYELDTAVPVQIAARLNSAEMVLKYTAENDFAASQDMLRDFASSVKTSYALRFYFKYDNDCESGYFTISPSGVTRMLDTSNSLISLPFVQYINAEIAGHDNVVIDWMGRLELAGKKQRIIDCLKIIDTSISDISTIAQQGQVQLYTKTGTKLLPLKLAGDGINRLLFIVLAVIANPNSLILVDEIEVGFHYSMYAKFWEVLAVAARENNCQIIATTHSYECIDGAITGIEKAGMMDSFCYYRVEHTGNGNYGYRYSGPLLRSAVETEMEVR